MVSFLYLKEWLCKWNDGRTRFCDRLLKHTQQSPTMISSRGFAAYIFKPKEFMFTSITEKPYQYRKTGPSTFTSIFALSARVAVAVDSSFPAAFPCIQTRSNTIPMALTAQAWTSDTSWKADNSLFPSRVPDTDSNVRTSMTAICSRVIGPFGSKRSGSGPSTMSTSAAARTGA